MMASDPCYDGSIFPHFAQDVSNLVIDGDYMLKKEKDTKGSRAWQQFWNVLVSRRPTRIMFYPVNTKWRLEVFRVVRCCVLHGFLDDKLHKRKWPALNKCLFIQLGHIQVKSGSNPGLTRGQRVIWVSGTDPVSTLASKVPHNIIPAHNVVETVGNKILMCYYLFCVSLTQMHKSNSAILQPWYPWDEGR